MSWEYVVTEKCEEDIKETVWRCGLDSTGSAQDWLVSSCEQVMNHQAPQEARHFLNCNSRTEKPRLCKFYSMMAKVTQRSKVNIFALH
jgi:hypothetical protein